MADYITRESNKTSPWLALGGVVVGLFLLYIVVAASGGTGGSTDATMPASGDATAPVANEAVDPAATAPAASD